MEKTLDFLEDQEKAVKIVYKVCTTLISFVVGSSAPCTIPVTVLETIIKVIYYVLKVAHVISKILFGKIVEKQNRKYEIERQKSIYENVITNHGNIITTFYATQQLKVMLGEISEGIAKDEEDENRRLALADCVDANSFVYPCDKLLCDDPTKYCDGGPNYPLIAGLKGGKSASGNRFSGTLVSYAEPSCLWFLHLYYSRL